MTASPPGGAPEAAEALEAADPPEAPAGPSAAVRPPGLVALPPLGRTLVMVGLMGAGKTVVGRRLAQALRAPFQDADDAIVEAAGMTIPDIFEVYGEGAFRDVERRVIARLLNEPPAVLALGGGAFADARTRARVKEKATSIWLKADLDVLVQRTAKRRAQRPLLMQGDPREILSGLMAKRHPAYAQADLTVRTGDEPCDEVVARVLRALAEAPRLAADGRALPDGKSSNG